MSLKHSYKSGSNSQSQVQSIQRTSAQMQPSKADLNKAVLGKLLDSNNSLLQASLRKQSGCWKVYLRLLEACMVVTDPDAEMSICMLHRQRGQPTQAVMAASPHL